MTTAVFKPLNGNIVGIIRVYETEDTQEPAPYKFFTVAEIAGETAKINGLMDAGITMADLRVIGYKLATLGVKKLTWTHKGRAYTFTIKQAKNDQ